MSETLNPSGNKFKIILFVSAVGSTFAVGAGDFPWNWFSMYSNFSYPFCAFYFSFCRWWGCEEGHSAL